MADLSFLETDSDKIYNQIITALEDNVGEALYPGDERRIFGDALVAVVVSVYNQVNDACKQKMLQYARGEVLDALGERYQCTRISAAPARTVLRFTVKAAVAENIIIPVGTRATADNEIYFQTMEAAVLQAGTLYIDVDAECCSAGAQGNDYSAGAIGRLVDLVPYIDTVENTVVSYGGDDGEPYPDEDDGTGDEHYRERIRLAPTALSVAGPHDAYVYHAKSADAQIADVAVISDVQTLLFSVPVYSGKAYIGGAGYDISTLQVQDASYEDYETDYENELIILSLGESLAERTELNIKIQRDMAGKVLIVPILYGGRVPDDEILDKVLDACSAEDVRPMTDQVFVQAPEQIPYDIDIVYYTTKQEESDCINAIESADGAISQFREWQDTKMGRDINPDKLRSLCLSPKNGTGCTRIIVASPEYAQLSATQVASFRSLTVRHIVEA